MSHEVEEAGGSGWGHAVAAAGVLFHPIAHKLRRRQLHRCPREAEAAQRLAKLPWYRG
jgi:hypothetical protein